MRGTFSGAALLLSVALFAQPVPAVAGPDDSGRVLAHSPENAPANAVTSRPGGERTELWTGKVLSATFKAGICTRPNGAVRGVFLLTHKNGETDVYHVYGGRRGDEVTARHASGHVFTARVDKDGTLTGSARIKNRLKLTLKGTSQSDVPLSEDCAPLQ